MKNQANNAEIDRSILALIAKTDPTKSVDPTIVAREIAGPDEKKWRLLMKPIRARAVALAHEDALLIMRKGKPVDPDNFKGIYRLAPKN